MTPLSAATPTSAWRDDATVIGLVGVAHAVSHFSQLLLAPLFPWLKDAFAVNYAQLGGLLTVFFVVSCAVQALSGFVVDRFGPRPVLFGGLALLGTAAMGYASSQSYSALALWSVVAGVGNGVFHPVDYTLLNRKIDKSRLGHAYSVHGITGTLGWALAPLLVVSLTAAWSWRAALAVAGGVAWAVLAVVWLRRDALALEMPTAANRQADEASEVGGALGFLRIPAVWMCFGFFFCFAIVLSVVQSFAPEAARQLHGVPARIAAMCLTVYMVCSACGMVLGGFLAADPARCERVIGVAFVCAALIALTLGLGDVPAWAVPVLFGCMGFASGTAGPSRDLIVKKSTPDHASGRVFGVVYAGLDIGQALAPLVFGRLMDQHHFSAVWVGLAVVQGALITTAFRVRRTRRTLLVPA